MAIVFILLCATSVAKPCPQKNILPITVHEESADMFSLLGDTLPRAHRFVISYGCDSQSLSDDAPCALDTYKKPGAFVFGILCCDDTMDDTIHFPNCRVALDLKKPSEDQTLSTKPTCHSALEAGVTACDAEQGYRPRTAAKAILCPGGTHGNCTIEWCCERIPETLPECTSLDGTRVEREQCYCGKKDGTTGSDFGLCQSEQVCQSERARRTDDNSGERTYSCLASHEAHHAALNDRADSIQASNPPRSGSTMIASHLVLLSAFSF